MIIPAIKPTEGPLETLKDFHASEPLDRIWGGRFRGWMHHKAFKRTELVVLRENKEYSPTKCMMNVCSNIFRFILPERVEFQKGWKQNTMLRKSLNASSGSKLEYAVIKYAEEERLLGVFRYPKAKDGGFFHPKTPEEIKKILEFSEEKVQEMLREQEVLTFEAFRIPIFSFEYFSVSEDDFEKIGKLVPGDISSSVRTTYESALEKLMSDVKTKIEGLPNYLLILENILDLKYKDKEEIVEMTGNIIHFGT